MNTVPTAFPAVWSGGVSRFLSARPTSGSSHGTDLVATHVRSSEPYARITIASHYEGLWRMKTPIEVVSQKPDSPLEALGRSLADYAAIVNGGS